MKRTIMMGLLVIQALTGLAQVTVTNEPLPGTREYYSKHVEGRYRYENGGLVGIWEPLPTAPGVIRARRVPQQPLTLKGVIVQIVGTNEVIVRTSRTMPSGAERPEYVVLQLGSLADISVDREIATNVVQGARCSCVLASGVTNVLPGYSLAENPISISFDDYLEVFRNDSQNQPIGQVMRVERISGAPGVIVARQPRALIPPPAALTNAPKLSGEALTKRLQEYQMQQIRSGAPPLPIPLTKEMDDQLVSEGILPPVENAPTNKANQASQAIGAEAAPQAER